MSKEKTTLQSLREGLHAFEIAVRDLERAEAHLERLADLRNARFAEMQRLFEIHHTTTKKG